MKDKINKIKKNVYIPYNTRIFILVFLILFFWICGFWFIYNSMKLATDEVVHYDEVANVNYKVHLKDNDFYEDEVLDEDMSYVASLIDYIDIAYNYSFVSSKPVQLDTHYDIVAKLVIADENNSTNFFEKEYVLVDNVVTDEKSIDHCKVGKQITINYNQYNNIANSFKSDYQISANSYLEVYMKLRKYSETINIEKTENKLLVTIPLSQKAINIKIDADNVKYQGYDSIVRRPMSLNSPLLLIIGIVFMGLFALTLIKTIVLLYKSNTKKSPYDKYLAKILKEYDRFIASVRKLPDFTGYSKIDIKSFEELLDVRDNVNKPIMYYDINPHSKCQFYIIDGADLYVYVLKAVDLEQNN